MTTLYLDGEFPKGMKETTTRENGDVIKVAMINRPLQILSGFLFQAFISPKKYVKSNKNTLGNPYLFQKLRKKTLLT